MYDYNNKSNQKQRFKSKKHIQHGVRVCSSLLHYEELGDTERLLHPGGPHRVLLGFTPVFLAGGLVIKD